MLPSLHDTDRHRKTWFGRICPWSFDQEEPVTPKWVCSFTYLCVSPVPLLFVCLLTELCTDSSGGQWEDLHWDDPLHWEKVLWGERADQSSGEGWGESGWRTPEAAGAGDCWAEEERWWAEAAFTHRGSHPFPQGKCWWWIVSAQNILEMNEWLNFNLEINSAQTPNVFKQSV